VKNTAAHQIYIKLLFAALVLKTSLACTLSLAGDVAEKSIAKGAKKRKGRRRTAAVIW
jgi:hypothetical protein